MAQFTKAQRDNKGALFNVANQTHLLQAEHSPAKAGSDKALPRTSRNQKHEGLELNGTMPRSPAHRSPTRGLGGSPRQSMKRHGANGAVAPAQQQQQLPTVVHGD